MRKNIPLLVICGPTATGKTKLALKLARQFNGELVSADSRQIYIGMNIGTGKDLPPDSKFTTYLPNHPLAKSSSCQIGFYAINSIPLWLYDVVKPNQKFSSFEYAKIAREVIDDIQQRNKLPIVVGGTGFYLKTLLDGLDTEGIEPNWQLRKKLNDLEVEELRKMLKKIDPNKLSSMNKSDRNNPRRLIRALEIAQGSNLPDGPLHRIETSKAGLSQKSKLQNCIIIGLTTAKETLCRRIDLRIEKRIKQGIVREIKKLLLQGYRWSNPGMNCLGYKEWKPHFKKKTTEEEAVKQWRFNEYNLAKRQLTWFKKDKKAKWFDIANSDYKKNIVITIRNFLK